MENIIVKDDTNNDICIDVLFSFGIEELNKKYIVYMVNDDGISDDVIVFISEIKYIDNKPILIDIKEEEKNTVLLVYEKIKDMKK